MSNTTDKPGIDERYTRATNATSLVVTAERAGAGDVLIASGWSKSRLGSALLRLASEWDAAEKPQPVRKDGIEALAMEIAKGGKRSSPNVNDWREARKQATGWLLHENMILMGKLKTLPEAREQVAIWTAKQGTKDAHEKAGAALLWWLDPNCKTCHGRRFETVRDTPILSGRNCPECKGSGHTPMDGGVEIPVLLGYIDECIYAARGQMKKRLRQYQQGV